MANSPEVRTYVTFKSSRFNQTEVLEHFINPCCFGEDCARWLCSELRRRSWPEIGEPWQEDWGWQADGKRGHTTFVVDFGLIAEEVPEWMVHIAEKVPITKRLFGDAGPSLLPGLAREIHQILASGPEIDEIRWHFDDLFNRGLSDGASDPASPRTAAELTGRHDE